MAAISAAARQELVQAVGERYRERTRCGETADLG